SYRIVLLVVGFSIPIVFTLLDHTPVIPRVIERLKPYLVYPTTVGNRHIQSLPYLLGNPPTMGQLLYVALFTILNIIFSSVSYKSTQPNTWFANKTQEVLAYISNRTGVIAFALAPLVIL